jgi:2-dehydropantoate 2-reductase
MKIGILGAGSLGLLFAAKLSAAGTQVQLITRTLEQAEHICLHGIKLGTEQETKIDICQVTPFEELYNETSRAYLQVDVMFVMLKQTDLLADVMLSLAVHLKPGVPLVCCQNGIGHLEQFLIYFPQHPIYAAVTTEGARRLSQNEVVHTGHGKTYIGAWQTSPLKDDSDDFSAQLLNALHQAGFQTELTDEIEHQLWKKLIINAVINPLTAILRIPNGDLLKSEYTIQLMRSVYEEAVKTAQAEGMLFNEMLWQDVLGVCERTALNHSSMLQDISAGRPTEIEWITGSILQRAQKQRLSLPNQIVLYRLVKSLERGD